jgi:hypothetical protein
MSAANTVLTFHAYPQNVTAYRIHGAYRLIDTQFGTTPAAELERMLSLSEAFRDEETGVWTNASGNEVAKQGDASADMGDYSIICYDLSEINDSDTELLTAMRKDGYAKGLADEIEGVTEEEEA